MRFLRRTLTGLFLMAVTLALLAWAGTSFYGAVQERMSREARVQPARERVFAANVMTVEPGRIAPELVAYGEVRSRRTLEVRATEAGTVIALSPNFVEGGTVTRGEVLVQIDPSDAERALEIARTDVAEAEANQAEAGRALVLAQDELVSAQGQVDLRSRALVRARDLASRNVGTEANVEAAELAEAQAQQAVLSRRAALAQAEARVDQTRTALERARIGLAQAERRLADTQITAEFSGTLAEVAAVEGGLVNANERLAQLIDQTALEASFRLSTTQYARLLDAEGRLLSAPVAITLDVLGAELVATGRIVRESGAVAAGQTGRLVFAALEGSAGFRPGDFVTVRIEEPALQGVALIPATAVDSTGGVLVLGEGDRLEAGQVELLRRQGEMVLVRAHGLNGREIVAARTPLLGAGIRVRPERDAGAPRPRRPVDGPARPRPPRRAGRPRQRERLPARPGAQPPPRPARGRRGPAQLIERLEQGGRGG
jgi:multidrug efflux pump subunit AcrA (membrane-fusion protein)